MEIYPLDERIRSLCARAGTAEGAELEAIAKELRAALHEHSDFVRQMARRTLTRMAKKEEEEEPSEPSGSADDESSKAAD